MNVWVVELADGRSIELEADEIDVEGRLMFRRNTDVPRDCLPVAVFAAGRWTVAKRKDVELSITEAPAT